jgi:2-iminobutanoate/2-iminopropanoate deaminase
MQRKTSDTTRSAAFGPYSPVRRAGNLYFVSGQVGVEPNTHAADTGAVPQMIMAMKNVLRVLTMAGLGYDDVVKTTLYLTDMNDFGVVNEVYMSYFKEPRPARSTVAVAELPRVGKGVNLRVEIEAIALRQTNDRR